MDHNVTVRREHLVAMLLDNRRKLRPRADLLVREDRVELLGVEVMEDHFVAKLPQFIDDRIGDRVIETTGVLMAEDNEDIHSEARLVDEGNYLLPMLDFPASHVHRSAGLDRFGLFFAEHQRVAGQLAGEPG